MKFELNKSYRCTHSASPGYKKGEVYTTFPDPDNTKIPMIKGKDGYNDRCSNLQSKFEPIETKLLTDKLQKPNLEVVK